MLLLRLLSKSISIETARYELTVDVVWHGLADDAHETNSGYETIREHEEAEAISAHLCHFSDETLLSLLRVDK